MKMSIKFDSLETHLEVKLSGETGSFSGYASVFDEVDHGRDVVTKGAFKRTLALATKNRRLPAMLWMHKQDQPIGVWEKVQEDEKGLYVEGSLALKTAGGAEAYELMKIGAITGLSIGYRTVKSQPDIVRKARILQDVDLFEISLVTFPMNDATRISGVKARERFKTTRDFEKFLRDEGFSHTEARTIAGDGFKALPGLRDEDGGLAELLAAINRTAEILKPQK
jgi:HK97 family phage prohead protease